MALKVQQSLHVSLKKLQGAPMELPEWSYNLSSPPTCRAFCYKKCSLFSTFLNLFDSNALFIDAYEANFQLPFLAPMAGLKFGTRNRPINS